jgi:ribosome-binding ATPase YchF (GTP1/OBG family)
LGPVVFKCKVKFESQILETGFFQVGKPAICLVNKMDTDNDEQKYQEFLKQLNDNRNEEHLKNLPPDCRPDKLIDFQDVIPMSAKFNPVSVNFVKERLRKVIDDVEEKKRDSDQTIRQLTLSFNDAMQEKNPKIY